MKFTNPLNQHENIVNKAWLWTLLFGPVYLAYKRCYAHAIIAFILAMLTAGISMLIYPFFAHNLICNNYLSLGWVNSSTLIHANDLTPPANNNDADINHIAFQYTDANNNTTNRNVYVQDIYSANGQHYLKAHCNDAEESRTFRIDRIHNDITIITTGEIINSNTLIDAALNNNKTPSSPQIPAHITLPTLKSGRLFTITDKTDYTDILTSHLTEQEAQHLTQDDINNIDPSELDLNINTFPECLNDITLKSIPHYSKGLGELLEIEHLNNSEHANIPHEKTLVTTSHQQQMLKHGFLLEIPRTQAIERVILQIMTLNQLKPLAKQLNLKTHQTKPALISAISNALEPTTPLPPLCIPNKNTLNNYLQALQQQYRKEALQAVKHAPPNYQNAIAQHLEHDADL